MLEQLSLSDAEAPSIMNGIVQASITAAKAIDAICDETAPLGDATVSEEDEARLENTRLKAHLYPENGECSLAFAKELVKEFTAEASSSIDGKHVVSTAVARATSLLLEEATNVHTIAARRPIIIDQDGENGTVLHNDTRCDLSMHKSVVPRVVDAALVSESLALRAWIPGEANIEAEVGGDDAIASSEEESLFSLQRSLLLDPENPMARCLLQHI